MVEEGIIDLETCHIEVEEGVVDVVEEAEAVVEVSELFNVDQFL